MPNAMPILFISHGSPEIAVRESPAHQFLHRLGTILPTPAGVLVISAHWETDALAVATGAAPATVYDFGRMFDPALWRIQYSAPGADTLARRAAECLRQSLGEDIVEDPHQGRDHGVWTPLHLMDPARAWPVTQLSLCPDRNPAAQMRIGAALRPLREDGVLIIASGAITHNLRAFFGQPIDAPALPQVTAFTDWFAERIGARDDDALTNYRALCPHAAWNHPTDEHLLPLYVALGAAHPGEPGNRIHSSVQHGAIAMDVYRWG